MDVRVGPWRKLSTKELMLLNCGVGRRILWVPWTERRSNQSILKEISPEYSLEGLMLKLRLQYFGHLIWRADSLEKTLMLGKIEGRRRRGQLRMRWLDGITDFMKVESEQAPGVGDGQGSLACCSPWGRKELDTTEWLNSPELIPTSWITALSWWRDLCNLMKLWATMGRATEDGWVIGKSSDKAWSTGGGNCNPPQYSCL